MYTCYEVVLIENGKEIPQTTWQSYDRALSEIPNDGKNYEVRPVNRGF